MSLKSIIDQMQTIHATLVGVKRAPLLAEYPRSLNDLDLPLVLTWPSAATWSRQTINESPSTTTQCTITTFVTPIAQGMQGSNLERACDVVDALRQYYQSDAGQTLNETVELTGPDDVQFLGLRVVPYAGIDYHAFQVVVQVLELAP